MEDLVIRSTSIEVGHEHCGVTEVRADIDPGDGDERAFECALPADQPGEDAANRLGNSDEAAGRHGVWREVEGLGGREVGTNDYKVWGTFSSW